MFCEDMANYAANKALRKLGAKVEKKIEANEAVIAETTRNISNPRENGWHVTRNTKLTLEEGVTYLFVLDGEQYVRQCKRISETCLYIGNGAYGYETLDEGSQIGGKDTGEPFCLVVGSGGGMMSFETEGSHTYSLWTTTETETIHPISDKYLPGPVVVDLVELGVMAKLQDLMKTNGGITTLTIDPDKLWNKVRNAPQIICKFLFQENISSGENFNAYLTGWYHVPATRMDFIETGRDAVSITFTFVAMNSFARVTLAQNFMRLSADENGLIYSDVTEVLLVLYPLTPAPGNF